MPFELIFTHPSDGVEAHSMDMGKDEKGTINPVVEFYSIHNGEKTDLKANLKASKFGPTSKQVTSYKFNLDRNSGLKGGGDWGLVVIPAPYYESSEDVYIQQITKVLVNKDDLATDWNNRLAEGYPEIIPLSNPITWKDNMFKGQVVNNDGKPVSDIKVVIEYLNADIENSQFSDILKQDKKLTMTLYTDANGYFSFTPVHSGYWGIIALNAGGEKFKNSRGLSQDAVLWIYAE